MMLYLVYRQLAPWTICPRQLTPNLQKNTPSFFYPLPIKRATKYMNPRLNGIQIIFHSFVHYWANCSSFFYPLPSLNNGGRKLSRALVQGRVVWRSLYVLANWMFLSPWCCLNLSHIKTCLLLGGIRFVSRLQLYCCPSSMKWYRGSTVFIPPCL